MNWQGELNKYLASAYKNWITSKRNIFTVFELFFWPMISLLSIGLLTRFLKVDASMVSFLLVGAIALTILQVAQIDVAYVLLFDMWSKSIKNTFISPVRSYHLVFGAALFGIVRGSVVFGILAGVSHYLFGFDFQEGGLVPVLIFLGGVFAMAAVIGIAVCISILTFGQKADVAAWSLSGLILLVSGIYYPVEVLPPLLQAAARLLPLTYFLEYYRSIFIPGQHHLATGVFLAAFYLLLGLLLLEYAIERARKTGILLRLSE
ncbi:MAG TPA: ABC transporter permease [Methanothrix sp.]|nr:ABC transporter permease [Methanothrix sp.]HPT18608.1 ABC transporter permease [Methanothrix sp.]